MSAQELSSICSKLHLRKNTKVGLLEELKFVVELYCAGQGPCHNYIQQRNRTGGWTDMWCQHDVKVGSKMEAMQESVSDVSDIVHSMKKFPPVHCLDDPCHLVR